MVAPMVGISHVAFRQLIRSYTPKQFPVICYTEMLSSRRLPNEKLQSTLELKFQEDEENLVVQLLANEEKPIMESLKRLEQLNPIGVDINMGCPVSHTLKHNWGVRLMGDQEYASGVVGFAKKYAKIPVGVKLRAGLGNAIDIDYLLNFTSALEKAGADWLTIHARAQAQKHKGKADWQVVKEVKKQRKIPVIVNGNIQTSQDLYDLLHDSALDGFMVARAATARPWIFLQLMQKLGLPLDSNIHIPTTPEEEGKEYANACLRLLKYLREYENKDAIIHEKFCFFVATGCRWLQFGHAFWKLCKKTRCLDTLTKEIESFRDRYENPMFETISLL